MANLASKVINIALAEVGYLEKKSNASLDNKTANAGSNNYTKYGRDMHNVYPSVMDAHAAWCDAFVDWCFYKAYGVANAKGLLSGNFNDYTVASAQLYKNKGVYYKSNPKVGDQIFFNNGSRICHTGLVYAIDSKNVYTIEGNTSSANGVVVNGGAVAQKQYELTYSRIDGYGRPKYDTEDSHDYSLVFNSSYYANKYPDLKKAFGLDKDKLLTHFKSFGMKEGRQGCWDFNVQVYRNYYPDLQKAFGSDLTRYYYHWMECGKQEKRKGI